MHLRVDDATVVSQLNNLQNRFGELSFVFLVSDRLSAEMLAAIEPYAAIVIAEREPADALISALTLAELGYHLSDQNGAADGPADKQSRPKSGPNSGPNSGLNSGLNSGPQSAPYSAPQANAADHMLSKREAAVLEYLCQGLSNKSIARELGIRETTVKVHLRSTYRKIGVKNRTQAAVWASKDPQDDASGSSSA